MTDKEKAINEQCSENALLIWRCITSEDKNERIKIGKILLKKLEESKECSINIIKLFDDMVNKLTKAAEAIKDQNEWLNCLYTAMGDNKKEIIYAANTARIVLENYKKKRKD